MESCYLIKSKLTGFVLEPEGGGFQPNARVTPVDANGRDSQIWYDDPSTGTIRNKGSQFCLDIENEQLVVRPFQQGDPNQQWMRVDKHIKNRMDQNRVLDIFSNNRDRGAKIGAWNYNGGENQSWDFDFVGGHAPGGHHQQPGGYPSTAASTYPGSGGSAYPQSGGYPGAQQSGYPQPGGGYPQQGGYPQPGAGYPQQGGGYPQQGGGYPQPGGGYPQPGGGYPAQGGYPAPAQTSYPAAGGATHARREFYIASEMHGKVVDIDKGQKDGGARILMWDKHSPPAKNQLWYTDDQGCIKSSLNDLIFCNNSSGEILKTQMPTGGPRSLWKFEGNKVVNGAGESMDIVREKHDNGAEICSYQFKNQKNQQWRQEFI